MTNAIASMALIGKMPGAEPFDILVSVAAPNPRDNLPPEKTHWECSVLVEPLMKTKRVAGENSLQALCLAVDLVRVELRDFQAGGGKLFQPSTGSSERGQIGDEFPLEAFRFSP